MRPAYLVITYSYAPLISARAFRWSALAEHWAAQAYHIDVVASLENGLLSYEQLHGVNVYRVQNQLHEALQQRLVQTHAAVGHEEKSHISPMRWLGRAARWAYDNVWTKLYWPDAGFLWYWPALKKAKHLMAQHQYDAIISVSPFFTAHLIGEQISRGQSACWLSDFGDPFSLQRVQPHNNTMLYLALNRRVERRILQRADSITVTTQPTADIYAATFPTAANKIRVIPPLLSMVPSFDDSMMKRDDSHIRLVYAGKLYSQTRSPDFLLRLFTSLLQHPDLAEHLELHLYGDISTVQGSFDPYEDWIARGKIVLHGTVIRQVVAQALESADILVNVGNKTAYQLPSKVIEYASTGKPILNLIQIEDDSSKALYESYPAALSLLDHGSTVEEQVEVLRHWVTNLPPRVDPVFLHQWLSPYQIENVAQAYDEVLSLKKG